MTVLEVSRSWLHLADVYSVRVDISRAWRKSAGAPTRNFVRRRYPQCH